MFARVPTSGMICVFWYGSDKIKSVAKSRGTDCGMLVVGRYIMVEY